MGVGWTTQLDDGRWRAFESEGSGPRRVQANAIRDTRKAARTAAKAKLEKKLREASLEPHRLTLAQFLKRWCEHRATRSDSAKELARESSICEALPVKLARRKLSEVRTIHLQKYLDDAAKDEAAATTRKRYTTLHSAMAKAVAWHLLLENPMAAVEPPPLEEQEATALSEQESAELLRGLAGSRAFAPATVAVTCGLRRGEVLALRWADVDFTASTLTVAYTVDEGTAATGMKTKRPKGRKGQRKRIRKVTMMAATVAALKAHRKEQAAEKLAAKVWHERGLVFPNRRGDLWRPSAFGMYWSRQAATEGVTFHQLRHTFATSALRAGVPVNHVAQLLGHSSPIITLRVYAHVLDDAPSSAVALLESSLGAALSGETGSGAATSLSGPSALK